MTRAGTSASARDRDMSKARTAALLLVGATVAFVSVTATGAPNVPARTPRLGQRIAAALAQPGVRLHAMSAELRVLSRTGQAHRVPSRVLRVGITGADVRTLNQRLFDLHFLPGRESSAYTTATVDAVIAFQKWAGITRDGTAGPQTQNALAQAAAPTPLLQRTGRRVEVSISKQLALEVSDGKVLWVLPVSTAMPGYVPLLRSADTACIRSQWNPGQTRTRNGCHTRAITLVDGRCTDLRPSRHSRRATAASGYRLRSRRSSTSSTRSARKSTCSPN